jgi:3-isopropylmalate dehydrogenase
MKATITVLPGDGIGPEIMTHAVAVLQRIARVYNHEFDFNEALIGGIAIDQTGSSLPAETLRACEQSDAVLLAAVGGPKWSDPTMAVRPEQGLLQLRRHFDLFANLRPVKTYPALYQYTPLREDLLPDVDILFVRELTGGMYFGPRKEMETDHANRKPEEITAYDTEVYSAAEVSRVARVAFEAARWRKKKVTSVDKANVMASSRLWRKVVVDLHAEFREIELDHLLIDACTMYLVTRPRSFDVILASNIFGDILSDEASVLAGSLGMLSSASLGAGTFGLYEPVHGSAPDIAGTGKANPIGMILSAAMMLRHTFTLDAEARAVENAVQTVLDSGARTADIAGRGGEYVSTKEFAQAVIAQL